MKKGNIKIFALSFAFVYVMIAGLCIYYKQPLIFVYDYDFPQFLALFILLGFLSLGLIVVMDGLEKILKKFRFSMLPNPLFIYPYFIILSAFGLFIFTLFSGYVESHGLAPFYFYGCVTNSCLYLTSGYTVTFLTAIYFAYRFIKSSLTKIKL